MKKPIYSALLLALACGLSPAARAAHLVLHKPLAAPAAVLANSFIQVTTPANGGTVTTATPTYAGSLTSGGVVVTVYVDNLSIGTVASTGSTGAASFSLAQPAGSPLGAGTHTVYATFANPSDGATVTSTVNTFTVAAPALAVTSVSPANAASAAARNTPVAVTFNQALAAGSAAALKVFSSQRGGERTASVPAAVSGNQLTFTPSAYDFRPGETVRAVVKPGVQSAGGTTSAAPYTFQFTTAVTPGCSGNFGAGANIAGRPSNPWSVQAGDFNNDGQLDLVYITEVGNTLEVQLNDGTGTGFTLASSLPVSADPRALAVGDVNNDGQLDVVVVFYTTVRTAGPNLRAYLGQGNGTFVPGPILTYGSGLNPTLALADFNGDGKLDVAIGEGVFSNTSQFSSQVYIRLGDGTGAFTGTGTAVGGNSTRGLVAADFNNDGKQDILSCAYTSTAGAGGLATLAALDLGNGDGTFAAPLTINIDGGAYLGVSAVDFNGDGLLDIAAGCPINNKVQVLLNTGNGTFGPPLTLPVNTPYTIATGDVNGDGRPDILAATRNAGTVAVFVNNGTGTAFARNVQDVAVGGAPWGIAAADFNGDGWLDLATSNDNNPGTLSVRLNEAYDLTVYNAHTIPGGTYGSITVLGSNTTSGATTTGVATLGGPITVVSAATVQAGGTLTTACQTLSGGAGSSFTLAAGTTLNICDAAGIAATGSTGAVRTATRSFSPDADYVYNGTVAQVTGTGLPATVRNLTLSNSTGLSLSQAVSVRQRVQLTSGNLTLNNQALTLLSAASGTALIANTGGQVLGATGTMQRHIETNTAANGYRHYASPVAGETVNTLATTGYTPDFSGATAYNTSAQPNLVTPFPTVLRYNQDRIATTVSLYDAFSKGWQAPLSGEAMTPGLGFSVQAPGAALVDFTGTFTTGTITQNNLNRTGADGGWQLLGNPYPSPLDWSTMTLGAGQSLENVDGALYVYQSSGPYTGQYRTYLANLPGGNSPLIPAGSGFFVRTTTPGVAGTVRFANANRITTFAAQPAFGRSNDTRPVLTLTLTNAAGTLADEATLYADATATNGVDATTDATKLANPSGLSLATVALTGEALAIDGRPALTAATLVPLRLNVPTAGTYSFAAAASNLPAGLTPYLRDLTTGTQTALTSATTLTLTAGLHTRYALAFAPAGALATAPALTAAQVVLYPNPTTAKAGVTVALPVAAGTAAVQATLLNALGQTVATATLVVRSGEASGTIATAGLAAGVYTVRLRTGATTLSKRLVVE